MGIRRETDKQSVSNVDIVRKLFQCSFKILFHCVMNIYTLDDLFTSHGFPKRYGY